MSSGDQFTTKTHDFTENVNASQQARLPHPNETQQVNPYQQNLQQVSSAPQQQPPQQPQNHAPQVQQQQPASSFYQSVLNQQQYTQQPQQPYGVPPTQFAPQSSYYGQPAYAGGFVAPPAPPQFGAAPQPFGAFASAPQQAFMPLPPQPYPGTSGAATFVPPPTADANDYYKGFYEGIVRDNTSKLGTAVSWLVPLAINVALFVGPIWYIRRRYMQQAAQMSAAAAGKAGDKKNPMSGLMDMMMPLKPKQYRVDVKGTTFGEVIGIPEAKEDLKQYVDFLKNPAKFTRLGARLPKGCLLTGGPGTGKTLLARAVAGEANTPFFTCSGADFIEVFGGSGPKRVRELFAEARAAAPCVVFIDEIDAIGSRNSGRTMGGGSSEENRTINQLLAELDGLTSKEAIVVVAATNFPDAIDKALLREGRFDRKVNIPMPDGEARRELFEFYLNRIVTGDSNCKPKITKMKERQKDATASSTTSTTTPEETISVPVTVVPGVNNKDYAALLSDRTPGVSPAQIATIVNEAALAAAVKDEPVVTLPYLQEGIDDVLIGKRHRQRMGDDSLRRTAHHEVGHAIMAWLSPLQKDVIKVSIIPRGRAGGYTQQVQDEAQEPQTDAFLFSQLCVLLGGRVAERIVMGDISTGALDDLQRATKISVDKILTYGMGKEAGQLAFRPNDKNDGRAWMAYSEELHSKVEAEARELVNKAYAHTFKTLTEKSSELRKLSELLLERKEIAKQDIISVLGERPAGSK